MLLTITTAKVLGAILMTVAACLFILCFVSVIIVLCTITHNSRVAKDEKIRDEIAELIYKQNTGEIL